MCVRRCKDYDSRNALHIAAAEGRLLAVSYLMSNSFSPHFIDRWGATAMDDALKGQTMYHMYCAKLIQSMGGQVSLLSGTEEGTLALQALQSIPIDDVRKRLMYLNRAGYNQLLPKLVVDEEVASAFERCLAHLPLVQTMIARLNESTEKCIVTVESLRGFAARLDAQIRPICRLLDKAHLGPSTAPTFREGTEAIRIASSKSLGAALTSAECDNDKLVESFFMLKSGCSRFVVGNLTKTIRKALEASDTDQEASMQINLAWDELVAATETQPLQGMDMLDSDEEGELYAELDGLMAEREYCEAHGIERHLFRMHRFQNSTLRVGDMEAMYVKMCAVLAYCKGGCADTSVLQMHTADAEPLVGVEDLVTFFRVLGEETKYQVPQFEIEAMFEDALAFRPSQTAVFSESFKRVVRDSATDGQVLLSLRRLVAGSKDFRAAILRLPVNEAYGLTMQKTRLKDLVGESVLRDLCKSAGVRIAGKGEVLFDSRRSSSVSIWFVVISGSLNLTLNVSSGNEDADNRYLGNGSMFGGCYYLVEGEILDCLIRCSAGCQIVEFPVQTLLVLKTRYLSIAEKLAVEMEESPAMNRKRENTRVEGNAGFGISHTSSSSSAQSIQSLYLKTNYHDIGAVGYVELSRATRAEDTIPSSSSLSARSTVSRDSSEIQKSSVTLMDLYVMKSGFKCIDDLWHSFAGGQPFIGKKILHSMQNELGEVGSGIFRKIFLPEVSDDAGAEELGLDSFHDMNVREFWGGWLRLLMDRRSQEDPEDRWSAVQVNEFHKESKNTVQMDEGSNHSCFGWAASLLSLDMPRLRKRYLDKRFVDSGRYEEAYIQTMGSLNPALFDDNITIYIKNLFPDLAQGISFAHCIEFKDLFGKKGNMSTQVSWTDIKKVLQPILSIEEQKAFVGTAFYPYSKYMTCFWHGMELLAAYHFFSVPLLLCFADDSASMSSPVSTCVFIPADILTFLSTLIQMNTAYKSSRHNSWETDRLRMAKKVGSIGVIPALPLDWFLYALGVDYEACLWIRMSKLLVLFRVLGRGVGIGAQTSMLRRALCQMLASLAVLHICCCCWYFISRKYRFLDPQNPYVWYKPNYPVDDPRYRPNIPTHTNAFEYDMLSCNQTQTAACSPGDSWYYFGMSYNDGLMAKYVLSLYFVSTRIANQCLYGNIVPQNFLEVFFSIVFMVFNLTLFRLVIGDLSALVMESDAGKFTARTRLVKIFSFISKNNFSSELANEIRLYCENASDHVSSTKCARVLRFLPRSLQDEVARHVCRDLLDRADLLAGCSDHFKDLICSAISIKAFSPEEYIFRIGEVAEDLYIVQAGSVDTLVESANTLTGEKVDAIIGPGSAVEQVAFFFQLRFVVSARAAREGGAVCLHIGRESFLQILKCFPVDEELVSQSALKTVTLAKTGTSVVSFLSEGEKTLATTRSDFSKVSSAMRHSKKNKHSIEAVESNRKNMKMLLLFSAVKAGDLGTVQWCLGGGGVSINDLDESGRCLLHVACCTGNEEITGFLLKASADINNKDHRGNTPLNDAVLGRHDRVAAMIRQHDPGAVVSFDDFQAGTLLCEAAAAGNLEQVERLVENKVEVNAHDYDGRTGLHLAACEGRAELVAFLLEARADASQRDRFGNTPLDDAIRHGHTSIKQMVYSAGARVSGMSNILKACAASAQGNPQAIELTKNLVDNGLDPKAGDYDGRTPLHLAACSGKLGLLEYFISKIHTGGRSCEESESQFNVVDRQGYTPLDDADRHGHTAAIVVLEAAGAMRRGDPRLVESLKKSRLREQEQRRAAMRVEAKAHLATSAEALAWAKVVRIRMLRFPYFESLTYSRSDAAFDLFCQAVFITMC